MAESLELELRPAPKLLLPGSSASGQRIQRFLKHLTANLESNNALVSSSCQASQLSAVNKIVSVEEAISGIADHSTLTVLRRTYHRCRSDVYKFEQNAAKVESTIPSFYLILGTCRWVASWVVEVQNFFCMLSVGDLIRLLDHGGCML